MTIDKVTQDRCYTIAEIGACHQGSIDTAKQMIDVAAWSGVDAVKGQMRCLDPGVLFTATELARPYVGPHSFGATYGEHREALEFDASQHAELRDYAESKGLTYSVSVWDPVSLANAYAIGLEWIKIPSAASVWPELLSATGEHFDRVILSTGMCELDDVQRAVETVDPHTREEAWICVLQCTTAYPCEFSFMDLHVIAEDFQTLGVDCVGLSGHHRGIAVDCAAVALGARVVERHFTLDRTQRGTDHAAALEPQGLHALVRNIRATEDALGSFSKRIHDCELPAMKKLRTRAMRGWK